MVVGMTLVNARCLGVLGAAFGREWGYFGGFLGKGRVEVFGGSGRTLEIVQCHN